MIFNFYGLNMVSFSLDDIYKTHFERVYLKNLDKRFSFISKKKIKF